MTHILRTGAIAPTAPISNVPAYVTATRTVEPKRYHKSSTPSEQQLYRSDRCAANLLAALED